MVRGLRVSSGVEGVEIRFKGSRVGGLGSINQTEIVLNCLP